MFDDVLSACYLTNRMPYSVLNKKSPFSYLYANKTPFSITLCVFRCTCFVQDLSPELDKLSPKSIKCIFVGYLRTQKGYRCYNSSTRKYLVYADVTFFESVLYFSTHVPLTISETVSLSLSVSLPTPGSTVYSPVPSAKTKDSLASKPVQDFRCLHYTHRSKVPTYEPIPANPASVDGPTPPPSASPCDLDIPITF